MARDTGIGSSAAAALAERYRSVITTGTLLFVVLCGLTVWAGWVREYDAAVNLANQRVQKEAIRLKAIIKAASDHVSQTARWAEDFPYHAPYPGPTDLRLAAQHALENSTNGEINLDVLSARSPDRRLGLLIALSSAAQPHPNGQPSNLDLVLPLLDRFRYGQETTPFLRWSYFFSARKDVLAMAPWAASADVLGDEPNAHSFLQHSWTYEITLSGLPENNPSHHPYWTKAYPDQAGTGLMVSYGIPVYWREEFIGVMGADVLLGFLSDFLREFPDPDGLMVISNEHGELLADRHGIAAKASAVQPVDSVLPPALGPWAGGVIQNAESGTLVHGWHVIRENIGDPQWTIIYLLPRSTLALRVAKQFAPQLGLTALLMAALMLMNHFLRRWYVAPALAIAAYVSHEHETVSPAPPQVPGAWRPWVDAMARAFRERREYMAELRTEIADRKRAEESLRETTRTLETLIGNLPGSAIRLHYTADGLRHLSFLDGGLVRKMPHIRDWLMGLSPSQLLETQAEESRHLMRYEAPRMLRETGSSTVTFKQFLPDGTALWLRGWERLVERHGDEMISEGLVLDVTEEIEAKQSLERINRILMVLSQANEELIRATDEPGLFAAMCRVIVETGGYRMAWVGIGDGGGGVKPIGHAGHEDGYLAAAFDWSSGDMPEGQAIRSGQWWIDADLAAQPHVSPWRQAAAARGYRSCIALPLKLDEGRHGLLSIYAAEPNAFGAKETALFVDLANDLSYGVSVMRERQRRAEMERILAHAQKMEALGQMAGGVAHDFNNLLGAILGFAHFIAEDSPEKAPAHYYARRIIAAGRRGKAVVGQILSFSHKDEMELERLELGQLLAEVHTLASASVPSTTRLTVDNQMPGAVVIGDANGLSRMLLNLCLNAHDALAGNPGTLALQIRPTTRAPSELPADKDSGAAQVIRVWQDKDGGAHAVSGVFDPALAHVSLVVSDDGCGMDAALLEKVFAPFVTTKAKGAGTGLGLAAVHSTVLAHSGAVMVESHVGAGTTFEVILPLAAPGGALDGQAAAPPAPPPQRVPCRVLLVDDDPDFGDMMLAGLERHGAEVAPCADPLAALAGVRDAPDAWDVLVTDQTMPNMTGLDLIRAVKQIRPDLPCILCTGFAEAQLEEPLLEEAGVFAKLYKPLDIDRFLITLALAVGKAGHEDK